MPKRQEGDRDTHVSDENPQDEIVAPGVHIIHEQVNDVLLLRTSDETSIAPADLADLAQNLQVSRGARVLMADEKAQTHGPQFRDALKHILDDLRQSDVEDLTLLISGSGSTGPEGRPSLARTIADCWGLRVTAPAGDVIFVPGGHVFVTGQRDTTAGSWRCFLPGAEDEELGSRLPAPAWQETVDALPTRVAGGRVVDRIPAGLLIRPAEASPAEPGDLYHSIPVHPRLPSVVVGTLDSDEVTPNEVTALLAAAPGVVRSGVLLIPGGRRDILPLAGAVATAFGQEVHVCTGMPFLSDDSAEGGSIRNFLFDRDGSPRWRPFVEAVACRPVAPGADPGAGVRVTRWTPALASKRGPDAKPGVTVLSDRWQVTATRAGLWIGPRDVTVSPVGQPVSADGIVVQVGLPGHALDGTLWPCLSRVLSSFEPSVLEHAVLQVHGHCADGGTVLREVAARHGVQTIRYATMNGRRALSPSQNRLAALAIAAPAQTRQTAKPTPRQAFRALAASVWERQAAAALQDAKRALPPGDVQPHDVVEDFVALRLYLTSLDSPWDHESLTRALQEGREEVAPYVECLASGLQRLPSYQGIVARGAHEPGLPADVRPGTMLRTEGPVCGLPVAPEGFIPGGAQYIIWSVGGRRVRFAGPSPAPDEIVFPPGSMFRVDAVRQGRSGPCVLIREITPALAGSTKSGDESITPHHDVLKRMEQFVVGRPVGGHTMWPRRCAGVPGTVTTAPQPAKQSGGAGLQEEASGVSGAGQSAVQHLALQRGAAARFQDGVRAAESRLTTGKSPSGAPTASAEQAGAMRRA
ncbi:hypothetical protein ACICHK_42425 (plasmid) [Streptomyces sp. AHU1]|uniref:hypothetical protein n=1 Tax=Streptomyces sp. AHU1 TaxID=3377215 RepID=UPI003877A69D